MVDRSSELSLSKITTLEWKLPKITTDNIVLQFKALNKRKPVPFWRYVFIIRGNEYYMTGTGKWRTCVC